MRLRRLTLERYGAFRDAVIDLDPKARLHIIVGPNESGKTTRRHAIADLLFGFEHRSAYSFACDPASLRVGGIIETKDARYSVSRLKRRSRSLIDSDGNPLDEAMAAAWSGGLDRARYLTLGSISHNELVRGASMLLEDETTVQTALFGAALGGFPARKVLDELAEKANELFAPRASKPKLNAALSDFSAAAKRRSQATIDVRAWDSLLTNLEKIDELINIKRRRLIDLSDIFDGFSLLLAQAERIDELSHATANLQRIEIIQPLMSADAERLTQLLDDREKQMLRRENARSELRMLREFDQVNTSGDAALIQHASVISGLFQQSGAVKKSLEDLQNNRLLARRDEALEISRPLLAITRPNMSLAEFAPERTSLPEMILRTRDTLSRYSQTQTRLSILIEARDAIIKRLRTLEAETAALGGLVETHVTAALIEEIEAEGKLEIQRDNLYKLIADTQRDAQSTLVRLGCPLADPFDSLQLRLPTLDVLRRMGEEQKRSQAELAVAWEDLREAQQAVDSRSAQYNMSASTHHTLSSEHLRVLRETRDQAVDFAVSQGSGVDPRALASYRALIMQADEAADQRFTHASDIANTESTLTELARETAVRDRFSKLVEKLNNVEQEREGRWREMQALLPVAVDSIEEGERLVDELGALIEKITSLMESIERARLLDERIASYRVSIRSLLGENATKTDSLQALVKAAKTFCSEAKLRDDQHRRFVAETVALQVELKLREQECNAAAAAFDAWEREWCDQLVALRLPDKNLPPERGNEMLDALGRLVHEASAFIEVEARIKGIRRDHELFDKEVRALLQDVSREQLLLLGDNIFTVIEILHETLHSTLLASEQRRLRYERIEHLESEERASEECLATIEDTAAEMLGESVFRIEKANDALAHHILWKEAMARVTQLQRDIELATGRAADMVIANFTASGGRHALEQKQQALRAEITDVENERDELLQQRGELDARRKATATDVVARDAQAEATAIGAEIDRHARQYAALTAARTILTERIEAYSEAHQDPVLRRASEYLSTMTLRRYQRIKIGEDETGKPIILVVAADGAEKAVRGLSEGTEDQLYFALRLATIEDRFDGFSGPPLLLDDTIKNFDETRSIAALTALADFSRHLQVIYFTPRLAVVAQAREALGDAVDIIEIG